MQICIREIRLSSSRLAEHALYDGFREPLRTAKPTARRSRMSILRTRPPADGDETAHARRSPPSRFQHRQATGALAHAGMTEHRRRFSSPWEVHETTGSLARKKPPGYAAACMRRSGKTSSRSATSIGPAVASRSTIRPTVRSARLASVTSAGENPAKMAVDVMQRVDVRLSVRVQMCDWSGSLGNQVAP
jgi:hypothetical protein